MLAANDSDDEVVAMYLYYNIRKKRNRKRFWVREIFLHRKQLGEFHHLISQLERDDQKFYFRGIAIKKNPTCQAQTAAWREL
jgi:hypothetical protein